MDRQTAASGKVCLLACFSAVPTYSYYKELGGFKKPSSNFYPLYGISCPPLFSAQKKERKKERKKRAGFGAESVSRCSALVTSTYYNRLTTN